MKILLKFVLSTLVLFSTQLSAQKHGGVALYKMVISQSYVTDKVQGSLRNDMLAIDGAVSDLQIELTFNTHNAIFELLHNKGPYSPSTLAAGSYCDCSEPTYYDLVSKKSMKFSWEDSFMKEKEYVIERPLDIGWKIEKESKKIGQYNCYKATATAMDNDGRVFPVEACFVLKYPLHTVQEGLAVYQVLS
jgi:GLPGLI family protein